MQILQFVLVNPPEPPKSQRSPAKSQRLNSLPALPPISMSNFKKTLFNQVKAQQAANPIQTYLKEPREQALRSIDKFLEFNGLALHPQQRIVVAKALKVYKCAECGWRKRAKCQSCKDLFRGLVVTVESDTKASVVGALWSNRKVPVDYNSPVAFLPKDGFQEAMRTIPKEYKELLVNNWMFKSVQLQKILDSIETLYLKQGENVFAHGEEINFVYFLTEGKCFKKVNYTKEETNMYPVAVRDWRIDVYCQTYQGFLWFQKDDLFGFIDLIQNLSKEDKLFHTQTVTCHTDVVVLLIPVTAFLESRFITRLRSVRQGQTG